MVITRNIINRDIKFHDIISDYDGNQTQYDYGYDELSVAINLYKKLLIDAGVKFQETVVIAESCGIWQLSALFASFELGLKVAITDYLSSGILEKLNCKNFEFDSKTKSLLPIDYTLCSAYSTNIELKQEYVRKVSKKVILRKFLYKDIYNKTNIESNCDTIQENCVAIKCSTSGTTGAPKCIEHSYDFLYLLSKRNSKLFSGNFVLSRNLNHGSSIFCYCIPGLASETVTDYYNLSFNGINPLNLSLDDFQFYGNLLKKISYKETHVTSAYANETKNILKFSKELNLSNVIVHVLTYIQKEWVEDFYKNNYVKDIISNFGSNETAGPVFLNKSSNENFSECQYELYDNFYDVELCNGGIKVHLPIYDQYVTMNDRFIIENKRYFYHCGRTDLIRINDVEVDTQKYQSIIEDYFDSLLIYDKIKSEIYLAIWNHNNFDAQTFNDIVYKINVLLKEHSLDRHFISKYDFLNYETYLSGIKLDMEKLREYFRNPDGSYKKLY